MNGLGAQLWGIIETIVRGIFGVAFKIFKIDFTEEQWDGLLQFVKFGLVGVWNTVFSYLITVGCLEFCLRMGILSQELLGTPARVFVANVIAWIISVFVSFLLNDHFVFKVEEEQKRSFWKSLLKCYVSYGFTGLFLNNILAMLWVGVLGVPEKIAPLISLVVAIPINFFMNKLWAFKTEKN